MLFPVQGLCDYSIFLGVLDLEFWNLEFGRHLQMDKKSWVYGYRMHTAQALLVALYRFIIGRINNLGIQCELSKLLSCRMLSLGLRVIG